MKNVLSMNEEQAAVSSLNESVVTTGAGDALRQAREAAGLHISALASVLKVPVKKLEALEGNRFDLLPDAVFARALAASVCRTLKIDTAPILALLPMTPLSRLAFPGASLNETFRSPGDSPGPSAWMQLSRPVVLAGLALMVGALVLVFLPAIKAGVNYLKSTLANFSVASPASKIVLNPPESAVHLKSSVDISDSVVSGVASLPQALSDGVKPVGIQKPAGINAPVPASIFETQGAMSVVTPGTPSSMFAGTASLPSTADVVVFTSTGESWVEATDARGQVVLRQMLNASETVGASGLLPLKVVVGRANVTQVQIRGNAVDLNPLSKDNVARFEVK